MKKIILSVALLLCSTSAFALISGTAHDFAAGGAGPGLRQGTSDQTCKYCHVPHNATKNELLWSRDDSGAAAATTFYTSSTMNATSLAAPSKPQSTLCLSCHNHTPGAASTSGANFGGGAVGLTKIINEAVAGLTNDHPIGFVYDATLVANDGALKPVQLLAPNKDYIGVTGEKLPLFGTSGAASLECSTCHAVHGASIVGPGGNKIAMFLRTTNSGSVLCLKCHIK